MATPIQYDAIIIGAGQAGVPLSRALAGAGWKTAVIERTHVGGTCINEGCTPTKTMVASARVAYLARRGADYGVRTGEISIDMAKVRQRKRSIVDSFRSGGENRLKATKNLDLLMGEARFVGQKTVEVFLAEETRTLTAEHIFINVGARPSQLRFEGMDCVSVLNSTSIMELDKVPQHLIIIGGGYIGLEFGQMFRRFGSEVTIIQRGERLLAREDDDVADEVAKILREDGVEVLLKTDTIRVEQPSSSEINLTVKTGDEQRAIRGTHLLVAAGRTPNTDKLNLAATGVHVDKRGMIPVNERLETNVSGIYALGDVNGGPAFTHISYDDFRIVRDNVLEKGHATTTNRYVPYTVFIDPQLGRIGLTEAEARAQGRKIRVAKMPMSYVARALEVDESRGFMKAIVDADTSQILGAAILGLEGGEIMTMLQIAMMGKLPFETLREATFAHPTLAESLNNLFGNFQD
ncbi:MAG: mercuric reductase [Anaerolineae bacterium]|nr:mercuric reductase [Anaerolineae bacterium]